MQNNHTPGKWEVADYLDRETGIRSLAVWSIAETSDAATICLVSPKGSETEQDIANATLMSAAPELLESVKEGIKLFWGEYGEKYRASFRKQFPEHYITRAEAAIAKAEKLPL